MTTCFRSWSYNEVQWENAKRDKYFCNPLNMTLPKPVSNHAQTIYQLVDNLLITFFFSFAV